MEDVKYRAVIVLGHDGLREKVEVSSLDPEEVTRRPGASSTSENEIAITPGFERYGSAHDWVEVRSNDVITRSFSREEPLEPELMPDEDGEIDLPRSERGPIHNSQEAGEDD